MSGRAVQSAEARLLGTFLASLRANEPDRLLAAMLAPAKVRADLLTIAAFGAELGQVPQLVTDPWHGELRVQWWRDAISGNDGDSAAGHPIVAELRSTIARSPAVRSHLHDVIDVISDIISEPLAQDARTLQSRISSFEGGLICAALAVSGEDQVPDAKAAARVAGLAYGLARRLERIAAQRASPSTLTSATALASAGLALQDLALRPIPPEIYARLRGNLDQLSEQALMSGVGGRLFIARLAPQAIHAFLPLVMAEPYLAIHKRLKDPTASSRAIATLPLRRFWRLWLASRRGRV